MSAPPLPPRPGPHAQAQRLAQILRVDHAGELAAVAIYRGQKAVLDSAPGRGSAAADFARLEAEERVHLERFERMILEAKSRPSLLSPLWRAAGFALGAATALVGESAAHACTEAVERVIEEHYARQAAELEGPAPELSAELARFSAEERAHRDEAVDKGARRALGHGLLTAVISAGCRAAIKVAERI
ncbi:MAG TPA: demethoxyubiquinone hydroxylase family protein [Caulobacteraceae bacterium]|nr:demethoxyubiquinone hydroxylase family protein [Caulobacteraceae bacterium]